MGNLKRSFLIFPAVLLLIGCKLITGINGPARPTATPPPPVLTAWTTATEWPTATDWPTATPWPAATPWPSTTPWPTATPQPVMDENPRLTNP